MILHMERELDYDKIHCNIELKQKQINNEDIFFIILEEINKLKNNEKNNKNIPQQKDHNNVERFMKIEDNNIEKERNHEKKEMKKLKEKWENEKM